MKRLSILFLLFSIGCSSDSVEEYSAGFPIGHAEKYRTTKHLFGSFYLHTWMHDTLYRHTGQELQIEPIDSSLEFNAFAQGAKILKSSENKYRFILDPTDSVVTLTLITNSKDTIQTEFTSPVLPLPTLTKEASGDSILLSLNQDNKRLKELLPKDTRYGFEGPEGPLQIMKVPKVDIDPKDLKAIRLNYRNEVYPVNIKE